MSEEATRAFLSVIAQVSATFIGFAFLIPVVQFMGSNVFQKSGEAIPRRILLTRSLGVVSSPIIVLFLPLLISLYLLSQNLQLPGQVHVAVFAGLATIAALVVCRVMRGSDIGIKEKRSVLKILFEVLPVVLVFAYIFMLLITSFTTQLTLRFHLVILLLVVAGLLLVGRNLIVTYERGFAFRPRDLQPEFKRGINELKTTIEEAINRRQQQLHCLQEQRDSQRDTSRMENYQQKSDVARQEAEIWRWQEILKKILEWERKFNGEVKQIRLSDCIAWLNWKEEWERHLEEFKLGTVALEKLIDKSGGRS